MGGAYRVNWMRQERPLFQASWNWAYCLQITSERVTAVFFKFFCKLSDRDMNKTDSCCIVQYSSWKNISCLCVGKKKSEFTLKGGKLKDWRDRWRGVQSWESGAAQSGGEGYVFFLFLEEGNFGFAKHRQFVLVYFLLSPQIQARSSSLYTSTGKRG